MSFVLEGRGHRWFLPDKRAIPLGIAAMVAVAMTGPARARGGEATIAPQVVVDTHAGALAGFLSIESVHGFNFDGVPTLVYSGLLHGDTSLRLYESQLINGSWETSAVPGAPAGVGFIGATIANATLYAGFTSNEAAGNVIMSNTGGVWRTETTMPFTPGTAHYGAFMAMGTADNRPYAVYAGPYPASGAYSPNALVLDQTGPSTWQEHSIPLPHNAGIIRFSPWQLENNAAVLIGTYGGFGDFLVQRTGGPGGGWSTQSFSYTNDSSATLRDINGEPVFLSSVASGAGTSPSFYNFRENGTWTVVPLAPPASSMVGDDMAVINGVPTIAYLDRIDQRLHLRQLVNGTFTDLAFDNGVDADWPEAVTVFQAPDGNPAIAYLTEGPGPGLPLKYLEVPEPPVVGPCILAALGWGTRRRRLAVANGCWRVTA